MSFLRTNSPLELILLISKTVTFLSCIIAITIILTGRWNLKQERDKKRLKLLAKLMVVTLCLTPLLYVCYNACKPNVYPSPNRYQMTITPDSYNNNRLYLTFHHKDPTNRTSTEVKEAHLLLKSFNGTKITLKSLDTGIEHVIKKDNHPTFYQHVATYIKQNNITPQP